MSERSHGAMSIGAWLAAALEPWKIRWCRLAHRRWRHGDPTIPARVTLCDRCHLWDEPSVVKMEQP